ncbi:hypothetical protein RSAG8_05787, partial [Rhizoctonia solani AG-8 WAC10335]
MLHLPAWERAAFVELYCRLEPTSIEAEQRRRPAPQGPRDGKEFSVEDELDCMTWVRKAT